MNDSEVAQAAQEQIDSCRMDQDDHAETDENLSLSSTLNQCINTAARDFQGATTDLSLARVTADGKSYMDQVDRSGSLKQTRALCTFLILFFTE